MTSTYNHSPFSIDLNEDQNHLFSSKTTEDASSSSSISYPFFINPPHEDSGFYLTEFQPLQHPQEANIHASPHGVSSWNQPSLSNENKNGLTIPVSKKQETNDQDQRENTSVKWMSSKMRLMRKMMSSDQMESNNYVHKFEEKKDRSSPLQDDNSSKNFSNNNNNNNNSIRVCADCNTTKTPLWRSGPRGPKSLCNACGIRQRKARRALAAAQANANGTICAPEIPAMKTKAQSKEGKANNNHLPFKKRCRFTAQARGRKNKLCFEDYLSIILSKNSAFNQQVFPQDEKEAAILLMALSYGLVHG
ncbi:putative GATA transcription factor 22 isoform X2 [Jatropha curcas]|uniref:putative GATA transcription factor 22 isoform X2 n=1 Tax=Jatropha curcas TaxID=180498 RepID=UPI0005FB63F0|nr:putative GATA transcription factor 22 isoform X2 [Jatropha curcas]